jgi:hypothetical protein
MIVCVYMNTYPQPFRRSGVQAFRKQGLNGCFEKRR